MILNNIRVKKCMKISDVYLFITIFLIIIVTTYLLIFVFVMKLEIVI